MGNKFGISLINILMQDFVGVNFVIDQNFKIVIEKVGSCNIILVMCRLLSPKLIAPEELKLVCTFPGVGATIVVIFSLKSLGCAAQKF